MGLALQDYKGVMNMVNANKIKGRIVEQGMSIGKVADVMGVSASTLGRKLRGVADFSLNEVVYLMQILKIPKSEFINYFMCD